MWKKQATLKYAVVGGETGGGTVDNHQETLGVAYGKATGSTATPSDADAYKFVGWYSHWDCRDDQLLATTPKYTPTKAETALWVDDTYYAKFAEKQVTINYVMELPDGNRYTSDQEWGNLTSYSQTVDIKSGNPSSTASEIGSVYSFDGWYDVNGNLLTKDATFEPAKEDGKNVAATYYAKFELDVDDLTINKQVDSLFNNDEDQNFVFKVTNVATNKSKIVTINMKDCVSVEGLGYKQSSVTIKDLPIGNYKIEELTKAGWRYTYVSATNNGQINLADTKEVTFVNKVDGNNWLGDEAFAKNIFTKTNNTVTVTNVMEQNVTK